MSKSPEDHTRRLSVISEGEVPVNNMGAGEDGAITGENSVRAATGTAPHLFGGRDLHGKTFRRQLNDIRKLHSFRQFIKANQVRK